MAGPTRFPLIVVLALASCSSPAAVLPTAPARPDPRAPEVPMSEPAEYDIDHVSRAAGEAIFTKTGIGDPYRTGLPYPIFLSLMRVFPETFGASTDELAERF